MIGLSPLLAKSLGEQGKRVGISSFIEEINVVFLTSTGINVDRGNVFFFLRGTYYL